MLSRIEICFNTSFIGYATVGGNIQRLVLSSNTCMLVLIRKKKLARWRQYDIIIKIFKVKVRYPALYSHNSPQVSLNEKARIWQKKKTNSYHKILNLD